MVTRKIYFITSYGSVYIVSVDLYVGYCRDDHLFSSTVTLITAENTRFFYRIQCLSGELMTHRDPC